MDGTTLALHLSLIRLGKGMLSAYEKWVRAKARMAGLDPNASTPIPMHEFIERSIPQDQAGRPVAASNVQPEQSASLPHHRLHSQPVPRDSRGRPQ